MVVESGKLADAKMLSVEPASVQLTFVVEELQDMLAIAELIS